MTTALEDRSCEDLHEDEVVILDSKLATDSLLSDMANFLFTDLQFFFSYRHFTD